MFYTTISMSLKLRKKYQVLPSFEILLDDDSIVSDELFLLAFNIKREVINVLDSFLSFLYVYDKRKAHNTIFLMLDSKYKSLRIISLFVGKEQGVAFVEEYDKKSLYPMLVKCHEHLVKLETNSIDHNIFDQDCSLDIFEQIGSTSESVEELVKREFLIFRRYQLDVKDIKYPLQWCQKHDTMFPTFGF
jgi:hypothetical protein